MTYSTSTTSRGGVLVIDDFEVLVLVYLRKGNTSVTGVDNPSVELEVVIVGEMLAFLGQNPAFCSPNYSFSVKALALTKSVLSV